MTSAASAVANAKRDADSRTSVIPQGKCLNWVWRMFGSQNSTGYAQGTLQTAMTSWNSSRFKHTTRHDIPTGAPVYFGVSPTRTDANKYAGDVTIYVGGGIVACTDASGSRVGYMTIAAREKQTARPFIGWTEDFGGRKIDFGVAVVVAGGATIIIPSIQQEDELYFTSSTTGVGYVLINGRLIGMREAYHQQLFARLKDGKGPFLPVEIDIMNSYMAQADVEVGKLVWDTSVNGYNGLQSARDRLAGADKMAGKIDDATLASIVGGVTGKIADGIEFDPVVAPIDYEVLASKVADKLAERLAT